MKYMILSLERISRLKRYVNKKSLTNPPSDWIHHLISLYIIRKGDGICLFSHHFQLGMISQIENQLVGMGFTAISQMLQEIVDSASSLVMMDLGPKKVLIEEKEGFLTILITTTNSVVLREKIEALADLFEKMFELQQRISQETQVCVEDYALTSELVSLIFNDKPSRVLEIIPVIFKSIRKNRSLSPKEKKIHSLFLTSTSHQKMKSL
ncbi:MAG: hypothetical protein JSW11_10175 [Candidatus Heimdallarchaeota archaeon]|nr:MAG: hypothetical protein JSW11_10175 [Candidatus Heimdallarchaeota archaeon]